MPLRAGRIPPPRLVRRASRRGCAHCPSGSHGRNRTPGTTASAAQPASSDEASALDAATQQAATAIANATQSNVQNIVDHHPDQQSRRRRDLAEQHGSCGCRRRRTRRRRSKEAARARRPARPLGRRPRLSRGTSCHAPVVTPHCHEPLPRRSLCGWPRQLRSSCGPESRLRHARLATAPPRQAADASPPPAARGRDWQQAQPVRQPAPQVAPRQAAAAAPRRASAPSAPRVGRR